MKVKNIALSFSLALLLSACGGGGEAGGESSSINIDADQGTTQTTSDLVSSVTQSDTQEDNRPKVIDNSAVALSMPNLFTGQATNPLEEIDK